MVFYEDNYNFLSKMCLGKMRQACCEMIATRQRSGARVIAAGSDASDAPEPLLRAGADVVLRGEGLAALVGARESRSTPIHRRHDGALAAGVPAVVVAAALRRLQRGRGATPCRYRELRAARVGLVDIERYRAVWREAHGYFSLNMAASRGCSFRCNWCAKPIWGNQYLQRSATEIAAEMVLPEAPLSRPTTSGSPTTSSASAPIGSRSSRDALEQAAAACRSPSRLRADLVSERMAQALRAAGCREVWLGAESGSQKILDAMNKGTHVAEIITARDVLRRRRHPRRLLPPARLPGRGARRHPGDARARRRARGPTTSASASPIRCPARSSTSSSRRSSARRRIGRTATTST